MNNSLHLFPTSNRRFHGVRFAVIFVLMLCCSAGVRAQSSGSPQFSITFTKQLSDKPIDGRMLHRRERI
jgi:hypothetical protein